MRTLALLSVLLLVSPAALAQNPAPPLLASAQVAASSEESIDVQVDGRDLVVRENGSGIFRATICSWSPVAEMSSDVSDVQARAFSWNYPHLQGIVFVDLTASPLDKDRAALTLQTRDGFEFRSRVIRPHDGMGGHPAATVDYWRRVEKDGYLAVLPLDRARARERADGLFSFERDAMHWPMAVIWAPTDRELGAKMGQALLAYDGSGSREDPEDWWRVPSLCGICQQQQVSEVDLDLQDRDSSLLLRVRTRVEYPEHAGTVPEGLEIEGFPLKSWLRGEQDEEAWYVVPMGEPLADALVGVALSGDARVQARLTTGETRDVAVVRVQLDPAFEDRLYEKVKDDEDLEWPNHLSSDLVSSWPNPFRDSTTIEITVPGTIGEAFELDADLLARVQTEAEPPFGLNPMVHVKVYNVSGQLVNILDEEPRTAGRFTVNWNGQDLQGRPVASGAYYIHVEMEEWSVTRRVLLLRN